MKMIVAGFSNTMTRPQRIAGAAYLPVHIFVLPIALAVFVWYFPGRLTEVTGNIAIYGLGFVFCLTVMFGYLRKAFDILLDNFGRVLLSIFFSYIIYNLLSYLVAVVLLAVMGEAVYNNPNDAVISEITNASGLGPMLGISIFLAPIVEEVLFRGALFGAIREKSRFWAYAVSIAVFGIYHVWQFAFLGYSWTQLLLYAVQYIPAGFALSRCYEQTNCIWAPIALHMINNARAMAAM